LDVRETREPFICQEAIDIIAPSVLVCSIAGYVDRILFFGEMRRLERLTVFVLLDGIPSLCQSLPTIGCPEHLQSLELFFDSCEGGTDRDNSISDEPNIHEHWKELDSSLPRLTSTKGHRIALRLHAPLDHSTWSHFGSSRSSSFNFEALLPLTFQCSRFDISCAHG
jgi:hypothetical protein